MNYRHAFHAGNFADVFKHAVLALLLKGLHGKDRPFCYIETHAGAGRYDLAGPQAQKTGEWRQGIGRLWSGVAIAEAADYLAAVRALNGEQAGLRYYPGSPLIARHFLRPQDRMVLCELAASEAERLTREFMRDGRVSVRVQDGYAALKALLPPKERRGLVLIDPPYETEEEFRFSLEALCDAHARWSTGIYAIWYPIKDRPPVLRFHRQVVASGIRRILLAELAVYPEDTVFRLNGCGMVLVNPPWQLEPQLRALLAWLMNQFQPDSSSGRSEIRWLAGE